MTLEGVNFQRVPLAPLLPPQGVLPPLLSFGKLTELKITYWNPLTVGAILELELPSLVELHIFTETNLCDDKIPEMEFGLARIAPQLKRFAYDSQGGGRFDSAIWGEFTSLNYLATNVTCHVLRHLRHPIRSLHCASGPLWGLGDSDEELLQALREGWHCLSALEAIVVNESSYGRGERASTRLAIIDCCRERGITLL